MSLYFYTLTSCNQVLSFWRLKSVLLFLPQESCKLAALTDISDRKSEKLQALAGVIPVFVFLHTNRVT